ncbi:MAG: hypothetical protein K1X88_02910 [Nannocystaceae bacterium]|nr:hypothetical protein [Nannocystaceae bacterium]
MSSAVAVHHHTLESFFFEEIEHVQGRTGKALPTEVEAYVVHLLAAYARKTAAAGRTSKPLALEYLAAKSQSGSARAVALRTVGDRALYISGVVPRSLHRTPVNVRYVHGIGESAYREVAAPGALSVLGTLADMFEQVAEVIGDVVELGSAESSDLMGLYERWRSHGDPRDAKLLVRAGVLLDKDGTDVVQ